MIRHVINWKLAASDPEQRDSDFAELAEGFGSLPPLIPEIKALWIGRDLDETEGNWDVVLIVDYASTADLEIYQRHPEHVRVKDIVRRTTTERSAVDFEL